MELKEAIILTFICGKAQKLGEQEKEYWKLHRQGMRNKDIAEIMGITPSNCRGLKYRAEKKIKNFAESLKKILEG